MGLFDDIVNTFFPTPPGAPTASDVLNAIGNAITGNNNVHGATAVSTPPPPPPPPGTHGATAVGNSNNVPPPPGVAWNPNDFPSLSGRTGGDSDRVFSLNLIDTLQKPPPQVTQDYVTIVAQAASYMGIEDAPEPEQLSVQTGAKSTWNDLFFPEHQMGNGIGNINSPTISGPGPDPQEKMRNAVNKGRNDVYEIVNRVNAFVSRAKNAGFVPPENPFSLAMSYNVGRVGFTKLTLPADVYGRIATNVKSYLTLLNAEQSGQLNLDTNVNKAAQLSHSSLSLEGFGGTGNTSVDLAKLLPDADEVKEQKAFEALSVFDFTKRIPKVMFTAFYAPDGIPSGVIVGWRKVPDASGYVVRRRNIFDGREATYSLTNDDVKRDTTRLKEYVKAWILSFYDNVQQDFVFTFMDNDVPPNGYFHYTVQAYQLQNEIPGTIFNVQTSPVFLSAPQKRSIRQQLEQLDPDTKQLNAKGRATGKGPQPQQADTISPYPVLAHVLLGDAKYDWLLACVNIRASINRGDTRTTTRDYSYLAAQLEFLFAQADAGKLVVPKGKDVGTAMKNIEDAISKYGVTQVLKDVLQETGALYHFDGKDPSDNTLFRNVDVGASTDSGLISVVVAAIDPETATMNLKTLATNLPMLLSGQFVDIKEHLTTGASKPTLQAHTIGEIDVPPEFDSTTDSSAEDEVQYLSKFGDLSGVVDLTTADGVATFLRVIRIFSDIGPNRGAPIASNPTQLTPDPVKKPLPPPPPLSSTNPVGQPVTTSGIPAITSDLGPAADQNPLNQLASDAQKAAQDLAKGDVGGAIKEGVDAAGDAVKGFLGGLGIKI